MKVAVVQLNAGSDKKRNINKTISFIEKAATNKAKFVLLPEVFSFRGDVQKKDFSVGVKENIKGETIEKLSCLSRKHNIFILAGSIYEKIPNSRKMYNTSVLIGSDGKTKAIYRKMHLFDANVDGKRIRESKVFLPGKKSALAKMGGYIVGLSICFDLRYPELYRRYSDKGAHILCVPSAFTKTTGKAHWEPLLRARAIENKCYVLAPNQVGNNSNGVPCYGNSMIVDPWGKVLKRASGKKEEILYEEIDKKENEKAKLILGRK